MQIIPLLFFITGLWNCRMLKYIMSSWPSGAGKVCNSIFEISALDSDLHECEQYTIFVLHLPSSPSWSKDISELPFYLFSQKENQNHSYSLKSSASFSVIEYPYKNLPFPEDVQNSTIVSRVIFRITLTQGSVIKQKKSRQNETRISSAITHSYWAILNC